MRDPFLHAYLHMDTTAVMYIGASRYSQDVFLVVPPGLWAFVFHFWHRHGILLVNLAGSRCLQLIKYVLGLASFFLSYILVEIDAIA